jgi:rare lipoprotein A (peptidoglycan hydrolase)
MFRRDRAIFAAVLCTAFSACTAAHAAAGTGGAPIPELLPVTTGGTGYGDPSVTSLVVTPIAVLGKRVVARGTMPGAARREVILQRLDARRGWRNVARTRVRTTERFEMRWKTDRSGAISLRAVLGRRTRHLDRTATAQSAPIASVNVYRPALATFYGPGFFGKQTACGQVLTPDLHGVAHKRLPCGTLVAVTYAGREIVVPVIDRGPFNGDYSWDLTQATADALGFTASGEIGYARL